MIQQYRWGGSQAERILGCALHMAEHQRTARTLLECALNRRLSIR
jgi:hypothetical protein